ncbi:hypothetical protein ACOME3_001714 [Neoechinorhynchus agilis]
MSSSSERKSFGERLIDCHECIKKELLPTITTNACKLLGFALKDESQKVLIKKFSDRLAKEYICRIDELMDKYKSICEDSQVMEEKHHCIPLLSKNVEHHVAMVLRTTLNDACKQQRILIEELKTESEMLENEIKKSIGSVVDAFKDLNNST